MFQQSSIQQFHSQPQAQQQGGQALSIDWAGKVRNYSVLGVKIFLLKLVTLGIYHFWGKTEIRSKLWYDVRLNKEPLEYTGTGMELFLGFLFALFAVFLPAIILVSALQIIFGQNSLIAVGGTIGFYLLFFYLYGVAYYKAQSYRLSRTQWRGIRGALKGSAWDFAWTSFWTTLVTIITLGLAIPWKSIKLHRFITNNTYFGETNMRFTGSSKPLFKYFLVPWLGTVLIYAGASALLLPTLISLGQIEKSGIAVDPETMLKLQLPLIAVFIIAALLVSLLYAWYRSKFYNYTTEKTHFSNGHFHLTTTGRSLMWLTLSNFLIVLFSLTILTPLAIARLFKYFTQNLSFHGTVDVDQIQQSQQQLSRTGEGLAEGFDISSF